MRLSLCNLTSLCTTYRFDDGSVVRRSSRELISYDHLGKHFDIDLYYNGSDGYEYYLPPNVTEDDRRALVDKIEIYFRKKKYNIVKRGQRTP